jgi:hypothetical protein
MLQRERPQGVRLGIEVEADAPLSTSGMQACSIALKRAEEACSDEMARDWSVVRRGSPAGRAGAHPCSTSDSVEKADEAALQASNASTQERRS